MPAEVSHTGIPSSSHTSNRMNGSMKRTLTLIVAATKDLGIGRDGGLPWPQLKKEMAYFARVTKRPSPEKPKSINAVVMGRKTWDSIPPKFQPLKGRLNIVISRSMGTKDSAIGPDGPLIVSGIDEALEALDKRGEKTADSEQSIGDVFIIGGSSVYDSAFSLPQAKRVLLTKIKKPDYKCDTFFPLDLDSEQAKEEGWQRKTWEDLARFAGGEAGDDEHVKEGEVEWEYCMYERR